MDIYSKGKAPGKYLTNFRPYRFIFDEVICEGMEGLLQSFKFDKVHIQKEVCKLWGITAQRRGQKRNRAWKRHQKLWWKGKAYPRKSKEYQNLLDRAFDALSENISFQKALLATGNAILTHSIGNKKKSETVLTEQEFCSRLMKIRDRLRES